MQLPVTSTQVWPTSVTGWVSLFTSVIALIGIAVAYGRWIEKLNGVGTRVKGLEEWKQRSDGAELERIRVVDRILSQHETLIGQIADAKAMAGEARREGDENVLHMTSSLQSLERAINALQLDLSQRMTAVETKLNVRSSE